MTSPKISIVTCSYNQGHFLEEAITSILDQKYPNLEYLVIDGGSTDQSVEVIKKYEKHIDFWVSEKDQGQSHAINKGFNRATGDVFGFINSDDYLYPGALKFVGEQFAAGQQFIVGWTKVVEENGDEWPWLPGALVHPSDWLAMNPIPQQSTFWHSKYWKQFGEFRVELPYVFDYEYWLRLKFIAKVNPVIVHRCLAAYRMHSACKAMNHQDKLAREFKLVRDEYRALLTPKERRASFRKRRMREAEQHRVAGWQALKRSDISGAAKHAREALRRGMTEVESWRLMYSAMRGR